MYRRAGVVGRCPIVSYRACAETDFSEAQELRNAVGPLDDKWAAISNHAELEDRLLEVHKLSASPGLLRENYEGELAKDDSERDQIRADQRNRARQA